MKHFLLIPTLMIAFAGSKVSAQAATCDLNQAESEYKAAKKLMTSQLQSALAKNEKANVDMTAYLQKVDALRACQKIADPKNIDRCDQFSIWATKELTDYFSMERYFEVMQSRKGTCIQQNLNFAYILKNEKGLQILYHQNGSYAMTHVIPSTTKVGVPTGRTFLFTDGEATGNAATYIVDFPDPFGGYDISYFWGLNVPVGNGLNKLERILNDTELTFKWSNGAYVTIDSISEDIIASNFLAPVSYKAACFTEQDALPSGKPRLYPKVEMLQGSEKYVGTPTLNQ